MCGISGTAFLNEHAAPALTALAKRMTDAIAHRGPDDEGVWVDAEAGVTLGQRRLSIIDLSTAGHQPMISADGRWVMVYNGELYNTADMRDALGPDIDWRSTTDTEVLLETIARKGVAAALAETQGMFALAVWDRHERRLVIARDRIGIKPLYWGRAGGGYAFASELKALHAIDGFRPDIAREVLADYFTYGYIPAPDTVFRDVWKVPPGGIVEIGDDGSTRVTTYWSLRDQWIERARRRVRMSDDDIDAALHDLLRDAVKRHLIADVPLGAFLSGGIDSSLVVALAQEVNGGSTRTFNIGFEDAGFDESGYARDVAARLGTRHEEAVLTMAEAQAIIPNLAWMYDEPFADSSQIPTHLVSRFAREHVTVAVTGDGGDEIYAGYDRYDWALRLHRKAALVPAPLKGALVGTARLAKGIAGIGGQAEKLAMILEAGSLDAQFRRILSTWPADGPSPVRRPADRPLPFEPLPADLPDLDRMQYLDGVGHLIDDILVKVDRASMAVALEARVPLLDHRVIEFAMDLAPEDRLKDGRGKLPFRRILKRYLPEALIERPKRGFMLPVGHWLRGDLRDWAEALLTPQRLAASGIDDVATVRTAWGEHVSGTRDRASRMWTVLMYQAWHEKWMGRS